MYTDRLSDDEAMAMFFALAVLLLLLQSCSN